MDIGDQRPKWCVQMLVGLAYSMLVARHCTNALPQTAQVKVEYADRKAIANQKFAVTVEFQLRQSIPPRWGSLFVHQGVYV